MRRFFPSLPLWPAYHPRHQAWLHHLFCSLFLFFLLPCQAENIAPFEIVSADLPPFAIENQADAPGVLVEMSELLAKHLQQPAKVKFFPWARATAMAATQARIAVLPLTRTPEREANYVWLTKLYVQRFVLICQREQSNNIKTLEQARKLRITVLRGSPNFQQLIKHQFDANNILQETTVDAMYKALDRGLVDAVYGGDVINAEVIKNSGRDIKNYYFGMMLDQGEIWLAGGKGFTDADSNAFGRAMEEIKKDGNYARLLKKYGLKQ